MQTKEILTVIIALAVMSAHAQPRKQRVEVQVTPVELDWTYELGDRADYNISILVNEQPVPNAQVSYSYGFENVDPMKEGDLTLKEGRTVLRGPVIKEPGFVRCAVTFEYAGETYRGAGSAGFAPGQIQPTVDHPEDFDEFWNNAKAELAEIPMDPIVTLQPDLCTAEIDVYHVNLQNVRMPGAWRGNSRFYGMLSVPKAPGKYPAILAVPGAGIRPYGRDDRAANGVIVFRVGIHGIPVNMDPEVYQSLATGALAGYQNFNLDDRDWYYYKRVYLGCVRAIDYIYSLEKFDGESLAVNGGSQGGALSIITAGLDDRVDYLAAYYPALSDLTGYAHGRSGGWPHMFRGDLDKTTLERWSKTIAYYDVVNFARRVEVPGWYSWGYNDNVCPPTSMHAAYNVIPGEKEWSPYYETEHWTFPEQREEGNGWLFSKLEITND